MRRLANPNLPPRQFTLQADINLDADAQLTAPLLLWVAPEKVLGGNVGLGVIVPYGEVGVIEGREYRFKPGSVRLGSRVPPA